MCNDIVKNVFSFGSFFIYFYRDMIVETCSIFTKMCLKVIVKQFSYQTMLVSIVYVRVWRFCSYIYDIFMSGCVLSFVFWFTIYSICFFPDRFSFKNKRLDDFVQISILSFFQIDAETSFWEKIAGLYNVIRWTNFFCKFFGV